MNKLYFLVPAQKAAFEVTEDCCYEKVVYDGKVVGITGKIDSIGDSFNSWDLQCYDCNPKLEIIPIDAQKYFELKAATLAQLKRA